METDSVSFEKKGDEKRVRVLCKEAGVPLAQIRQEEDVLVLVPETLASLPGADALQELSDRLQNLGYRYVAFSIDTTER